MQALYDECGHEPVPLSDGELADSGVECRLHGSRFGLATGRVLSPPVIRLVATFAVRVDGIGSRSSTRARLSLSWGPISGANSA